MVETAQRMLSGELSFIEGSRLISALSFAAEFDRYEDEFTPFIAVDSETDALPITVDIRRHWNTEALRQLQPKIDSAEEWAKRTVEPYLHKLIDRLGHTSVRRLIGETAHAMLASELEFFAGARQILMLREYAELAEFDADLLPLSKITSKHDHLPLSDGRENWPPELLNEKYPEIREAEEWARKTAAPACRRLIERFRA